MIKTIIKHIRKKTLLTTAMKATQSYYNKNVIKITTHLEMRKASLDIEFPFLMGPCVVFGSAPTATLPTNYDNSWTLITVNAAQAISDRFGCKIPDATIMTSGILTDNHLNDGSKKALINLRTNRLVLINSAMSFIQARSLLSDMNYNYSNYIPISVAQRAKITKRVYGCNLYSGASEEKKLSTGLFSVTLALYMKIEPIIMSGFSFSVPGHGYNDKYNERKHTKNDKFAIDFIKHHKMSVFAADKKFADESGLELWKCKSS